MLVGNANYTWLIWSKLRTNRSQHSKSQDAPSYTQTLLGVAPHCLAAVGSEEEYFQFLLGLSKQYITPPVSTNTENVHTEKKKKKKIKRQLIAEVGWGNASMGISSRTKALPSQPQPPAHYCSRSEDLLHISETPDGSQSRCLREVGLWLQCCLHTVAKAESFLNALPYLNSTEATGLRRWKPVQQVHAGATGWSGAQQVHRCRDQDSLKERHKNADDARFLVETG